MGEERNRMVIEQTFAAAAQGDVEGVLKNWADDGVLCDWTLDRIARGKDELRPYLEAYFAAFSSLAFTPTNIIVDNDQIVVEWADSTAHVGDFFGIPPSGRSYDLRGVDIFEMRNGKIQEERSFYGSGSLLTDLRG